MTQTRHIILTKRPEAGVANLDNLSLEQTDLPDPGAGQIAVRLIWMSLDPYMRGRMNDARSYIAPFELGKALEAGAVAEVTASNSDRFAVGDIVTGMMPWAEHAVLDDKDLRKVNPAHGPLQGALSVLGMPGITAWAGLCQIGEAKAGETVVVSAATGAVGSVVGQIAKARGLRTVGVAGGPEKCRIAVEELGYDACLDHRAGDTRDLSQRIKEAAPDGVDIYFENVGGKTLSAVFPRINTFGRIAVCGAIAWYNGDNLDDALPLPSIWLPMIQRRIKAQGFISFDFFDQSKEFMAEVLPLMQAGKIKLHETVAEGLDAAPEAFFGMLAGKNIGKQLVRIGADPA